MRAVMTDWAANHSHDGHVAELSNLNAPLPLAEYTTVSLQIVGKEMKDCVTDGTWDLS